MEINFRTSARGVQVGLIYLGNSPDLEGYLQNLARRRAPSSIWSMEVA
jgi:hypothetical protein